MSERIEEPSLEETLIQLRELSQKHSTLHEFQVAQLNIWAKCMAPYFEDFKIRAELTMHELDYDIKDTVIINDALKTKLKLMTNTIKWMLGQEWVVRFNFENGIDENENPRHTRRNSKTAKPKRKRRSTKLARRR